MTLRGICEAWGFGRTGNGVGFECWGKPHPTGLTLTPRRLSAHLRVLCGQVKGRRRSKFFYRRGRGGAQRIGAEIPEGRAGLDSRVRGAIASSGDYGLLVNDTPPVILSEGEESLP